MKAFPISWVTTGQTLLIVGGGPETDSRLRHALQFDWQKIRVVLAKASTELQRVAASDHRAEIVQRAVTEDDVAEAGVVIEDSGDRATAERLRAWCGKHGAIFNAMDKPDLCDFYYMSLLFRNPLVLAIGSGGDAPAVSSSLRRHLDETVGPGWATAAHLLSRTRQNLPSGQKRIDLLRNIARHPRFLEMIGRNDADAMKDFIEHELHGM